MNVTRVAARIASGTVGGLAWACALRAYMSEISGYSTFTWAGTFLGILLPGVLAGGAIGAATVLDSSGRRQRIALRCCAGAVLGFAVFPQLVPGMFAELVTTGLGGGAIGVAVAGLAGGYAIGGRRTWLRVIGAICASVVTFGVMATVPGMGGAALGVTVPRGLWAMLLAGSLLVSLCLAAAVPFRRLSAPPKHRATAPSHAESASVKSLAPTRHRAV